MSNVINAPMRNPAKDNQGSVLRGGLTNSGDRAQMDRESAPETVSRVVAAPGRPMGVKALRGAPHVRIAHRAAQGQKARPGAMTIEETEGRVRKGKVAPPVVGRAMGIVTETVTLVGTVIAPIRVSPLWILTMTSETACLEPVVRRPAVDRERGQGRVIPISTAIAPVEIVCRHRPGCLSIPVTKRRNCSTRMAKFWMTTSGTG